MADKVNSYGRSGLDINQARNRTVSKVDRGEGARSKSRSEAPRDAVEVSDTATRLKQIETRLANSSEVDQARVDKVRQRIQAGEYKVDPAKVAQKMLKLEQDLS